MFLLKPFKTALHSCYAMLYQFIYDYSDNNSTLYLLGAREDSARQRNTAARPAAVQGSCTTGQCATQGCTAPCRTVTGGGVPTSSYIP